MVNTQSTDACMVKPHRCGLKVWWGIVSLRLCIYFKSKIYKLPSAVRCSCLDYLPKENMAVKNSCVCVLYCIRLTPRSRAGWKKQGRRHSEMRSAEPMQWGGQWHCFTTSICPQSTAEKREWWLDRQTNSLSAWQLRKMGLWLWQNACALYITPWLNEDKVNVIIYKHVTLPAGGTLVYRLTAYSNVLSRINKKGDISYPPAFSDACQFKPTIKSRLYSERQDWNYVSYWP